MAARFFDHLPQPCCVISEGHFSRTNAAWRAAFGDVSSLEIGDVLAYARKQETVRFEVRGRPVWYRWYLVSPSEDASDAILAVDVTAECEALDKLKLLDRYLPGVAFIYRTQANAPGKFEFVSDSVRSIYGVSPTDIYENPGRLFSLIHRADLPKFFREMEDCRQLIRPGKIEFRVRGPNGIRFIRGTWNPAVQMDGSIIWTGVYMDIHDARVTADRLRETSERFELAVRGTNDGIWDWDLVHNEIWLSPRWKAILGYADYELPSTNETWRRMIHEEDIQDAWDRANAVIEGKASEYLATHRYWHRDGSFRYLLSRAALLRDQSGRAIRMAGAVTDVTELIQARELAEAANRAKSEFLANMSHEIRTPMNGVLGMAQLLQGTELSKNQRHYVDAIRSSADSLLTILNDILDLSKIEAGKLKIEPMPSRPAEILKDMVGMYRPMAAAKGLTLNTAVQQPLPCLLLDPIRLRQIVTNLIGNAIKFTHTGSVSVQVKYADGHLHVIVQDTGIGIAEENARTIFQSFSQADSSTSRLYGGSGLGLSIAQSLVRLMDGEIGVTSEVGQGSEFWVIIPADVCAPEHAPEPEVMPDWNQDEQQMHGRILLAEDNEVNVLVAQTLLEDMGFDVDVVANGVQAVDKAVEISYDLILMDLHMPLLDGAEASRRIRAAEQGGKRTPIFAITAAVRKEDRQTCADAGMDDFITKPFDINQLRRMLAGLFLR